MPETMQANKFLQNACEGVCNLNLVRVVTASADSVDPKRPPFPSDLVLYAPLQDSHRRVRTVLSLGVQELVVGRLDLQRLRPRTHVEVGFMLPHY